MSKCTKIRCPIQFDKVDKDCDIKECSYRTEQTFSIEDIVKTIIETVKKDVAKDILNIFNSTPHEYHENKIKELAKQYGVEVQQ